MIRLLTFGSLLFYLRVPYSYFLIIPSLNHDFFFTLIFPISTLQPPNLHLV